MGDGEEHGTDPAWDNAEAEALYGLLENHVIPDFYNRGETGVAAAWVARMRESMARLTPQFSASRAVCEYTQKHYVPSAAAYRARAADKGALGIKLEDWRQVLAPGSTGGNVYTAETPVAHPASYYTARAIPHLSGAAAPLEVNQILWQR